MREREREKEGLEGILGASSSASTQRFISVSCIGSQVRTLSMKVLKFNWVRFVGEVPSQ